MIADIIMEIYVLGVVLGKEVAIDKCHYITYNYIAKKILRRNGLK